MDKRQINPWTWQERFGFAQAWRVDGAQSIVFAAGQAAVSPDGEVLAVGDLEGRTRHTFQNLRTVRGEAGASFDDVVKVTLYLTDISKIRDARARAGRVHRHGAATGLDRNRSRRTCASRPDDRGRCDRSPVGGRQAALVFTALRPRRPVR